jgi:hypothetical protein
MRWAALPITDRRWAAPLSAIALGFGLFVGVAIGPGAPGTLATGVPQIIEIPGLGVSSSEEEDEEEPAIAEASSGGDGGRGESAFSPLLGEEEPALVAPEEETPSSSEPPVEEEEEAPAKPEEEELAGTVVHVNPAAGSYTVVESGGVMSAVHASKLPHPGSQVKVPIETLANGTLAEAGKRVRSGERAWATLAGIVTSVDAAAEAPSYAVSNRGTSVLVHVHPGPSGAAPTLPALGAYASVAVEIEQRPTTAASVSSAEPAAESEPPLAEEPPATEPPAEPTPTEIVPAAPAPAPEAPAPPAPAQCAPDPARPPVTAEPSSVLWQRQATGGGAPFTHADFTGIVTAVCPDTAQLLVSADDVRESGRDLLFAVPSGIDASKLEVGGSILIAADIAADGALTVTGLASDEHRKGADDAKATQGDLAPEKDG